MLKYISGFIFAIIFSHAVLAQEVTGEHEVTAGTLPNEFTIKTTVKGLVGADLARIKYFIPKAHTYKASSNNSFFSKIEDDYVKFYIMSIPNDGVVVIELGVVLASEGSFTFPVEFQYSKNEEKIVFECKPLIIENGSVLVAEEPSLNEKIQTEAAKGEAEAARIAKLEEEKTKKAAEELAAKKKTDEAAAILAASTAAAAKDKEAAEALAAKKSADEEALKLKEQQEAEVLAAKNKADEETKLAEAQQLKEQQETERLALEKEKAEAAALLAAKKEKEAKTSSVNTGVKYGVQIFALSKYTEQKVRDFCKRNNLDYALISTYEIKGITKIRYGAVNSKTEAEALKKELLTRPQINGGFVVKVSN